MQYFALMNKNENLMEIKTPNVTRNMDIKKTSPLSSSCHLMHFYYCKKNPKQKKLYSSHLIGIITYQQIYS
jgi:hypothetical protein